MGNKMRILFCNIAWMKFYKGIYDGDIPVNGGSFVKKNQDAYEKYNFCPIFNEDDGKYYCYGHVQTNLRNNVPTELHIENIEGCEFLKNDDCADDVLVIFCARPDRGNEKSDTQVVGWYKHATVYRYYQEPISFDDMIEERSYNILAESKNVVLLPESIRYRRTLWWVPRASEGGKNTGIGRTNYWMPNLHVSDSTVKLVNKLVKQIDEYDGENWIDRYE